MKAFGLRSGIASPTTLREPFLKPAPPPVLGKSSLPQRWLVLALASLLMIGNYYCYDNPAALLLQLREKFAGNSRFDVCYEMFYSVYSLPNVFLPLIGGLLVDRVGVLFSLHLFALLVLLGQTLFAAATTGSSLPLMILGRAFFGLGGESISVAQNAIVTNYFAGKELALALGINLSSSRLGSVINNAVSPAVANASSVDAALWLGTAVCCLSFAACMLLALVDTHATRSLRRAHRAAQREYLAAGGGVTRAAPEDVVAGVACRKPADFGGEVRLGLKPSSPQAAPAVAAPPAAAAPTAAKGTAPRGTAGGGAARGAAATVTAFPRSFWLLAVCCMVIYSCVLPFNNIAASLLLDRDYFPYGTEWRDGDNRTFVYSQAVPEPPGSSCASSEGGSLPFCVELARSQRRISIVMSEPYVMSALLSPLLGYTVDRYGQRANLAIVSALILMLSHLMLALTHAPAAVLLVGLGLGYSTFAAVVWPSIPLVVDKNHLGTAYGMLTALQNIGLFGTPLLVGSVYERTSSLSPSNPYVGVELYFTLQASLGLTSALLLWADAPTRRKLNATRPAAGAD